MPTIITPALMRNIDTAFSTAFNERLTGVETTYARIAMSVPSTTAENFYPYLKTITGMREWVGERVYNRLATDGFVIRNKKFEDTLTVPRETIEDDQYGVFTPIASDLGQAAAELPDDLIWDLVAAGFDTLGPDGQYFFDTDHPVENAAGAAVSVSNFGGGAGAPWYLFDTTRAIKPLIWQSRTETEFVSRMRPDDPHLFDADEYVWGVRRRGAAGYGSWRLAYGSKQTLDATNYSAARAAMRSQTDRGRHLRVRPTLLVVPPSLEDAARKLLAAERDSAGATNVWRGTAELHVEERLE